MKIYQFVFSLLVLCSSLPAQIKTTRIRGTVEDTNTRRPIAGATVSASGDTAQKDEITDDNGFFRLVIEGVAPGDLVRLRVIKSGYTVYDRQIVASEEIPITIDLHRPASATTPPPAPLRKPAVPSEPASAATPPPKPVVPSDPVTAHYIEVMTTESSPLVRLNALDVIVKSTAENPAALTAVAAAVNDADYRVRENAAYYLGSIRKATPEVITALRIAANDLEPLVRSASMHALGRLSPNKDAVDALFRIMGAPPVVNLDAALALAGTRIDDPRLMAALIYEATAKNNNDAAAALVKSGGYKDLIPALFTALGTQPNVNISAMHVLQSLGVDDPRLMSALIYEATIKKDNDAIAALGHYPNNKEAVEALLVTLGTPTATNDTAMTILCGMGIDDPRLSEVLIAKANGYHAQTVGLLLKKAPLSQALIARLVQYVATSLDGPQNFQTQIYINILLQAGGAAGREALHRLLAAADAQHQALLAIAWIEVDHKAKVEILPDIHLPGTQTYLVKMGKTAAMGIVALPEYDSSAAPCNEGPSLRAVMGLSMLDLAPRDRWRNTLIEAVNASVDSCSAYAAAAVAWFGPTILRAASANLIHSARCKDKLAQKAATDTLALLGDEHTIAQLQEQNNLYNCNGDDPMGSGFHLQDDLMARIRARLNAR